MRGLQPPSPPFPPPMYVAHVHLNIGTLHNTLNTRHIVIIVITIAYKGYVSIS